MCRTTIVSNVNTLPRYMSTCLSINNTTKIAIFFVIFFLLFKINRKARYWECYTCPMWHIRKILYKQHTFLAVRILMTILEVINFGSTCWHCDNWQQHLSIIDTLFSKYIYTRRNNRYTWLLYYTNNHIPHFTAYRYRNQQLINNYLTKICSAFVLDYRWRNVSTRHFGHGRPRGILGNARSVYANGWRISAGICCK